jgi:hypothetical protein
VERLVFIKFGEVTKIFKTACSTQKLLGKGVTLE